MTTLRQFIGDRRRFAQSGIEASVGYGKDYWRGAVAELEGVEKFVQAASTSVMDECLDALLELVNNNIRDGVVNTTDVRRWIDETRALLPGATDTDDAGP